MKLTLWEGLEGKGKEEEEREGGVDGVTGEGGSESGVKGGMNRGEGNGRRRKVRKAKEEGEKKKWRGKEQMKVKDRGGIGKKWWRIFFF